MRVRGLTVCLCVALASCLALPTRRADDPPTYALVGTEATTLGQLFAPGATQHARASGFVLLDRGDEALRARLAAIDLAERAIDGQYFIWNGDAAGRLVIAHLLRAADRGVRVRLLIDDFHAGGRDYNLQALDSHPNVEVRLYNPFERSRLTRLLQLLSAFWRLNRRMHNKLLIADNQLAIVGGRNIANEYFAVDGDYNFRDFDLLAVGPVVPQASGAFDAYWNSPYAIPVAELLHQKRLTPREVERRLSVFTGRLSKLLQRFPYPLDATRDDCLARLRGAVTQLKWGRAEVLYDDPSKVDGHLKARRSTAIGRRLEQEFAATEHELVAESAYFVPSADHRSLNAMRARGVAITVLTNSIGSTDVVAAYTGYARRRRELLENGVRLFELRPDAAVHLTAAPSRRRSRVGLHSKAMIFDRQRVFVGSVNLDPRSRFLDTEIGFLVDSPEIARQLFDDIAVDLRPENSWRLGIGHHGGVVWTGLEGDHLVRTGFEPGDDPLRALGSLMLSLLPLYDQL